VGKDLLKGDEGREGEGVRVDKDTAGVSRDRGLLFTRTHTTRIVNPLTTMFDSCCYILRVIIISDIMILEGGVCVGEIASGCGLVEAHERPLLQGLVCTARGRGPTGSRPSSCKRRRLSSARRRRPREENAAPPTAAVGLRMASPQIY
jgi:hypothetical protein